MLRILYGTAGSGKTALINQEIRARVLSRSGRALLIVPEQYSHECERELCAVCGDSLSLYAEVLSFSRLAVRVAQETGSGGKTPLDKGGRLLCTAFALKQIYPRLTVYKAAGSRAELQSGIEAMISELKAAGVTAETLSKTAEDARGELSDKLRDLALCMEAYDAVLAGGHADGADRLLRLAETVAESSAAEAAVYFDGFIDFTGAEMRVIEALLRRGTDVTVCLTLDELDGSAENFAPSRRAALLLKAAAENCGAEFRAQKIAEGGGKAEALEFYTESLFRYTSETMPDDGAVEVYRCGSVGAECELAAWRCIELVRGGCRWRDIAIAARGFERYASRLEEVFRRCGVPLFTARRSSVTQKSVPALIASAFDVILGGWDLIDVREYYKIGLLPLETEALDVLDSYCTRWELRPSVWTQKDAWRQHPDGFGAEFDEKSLERLGEIDALRRRIAEPLNALQKRGAEAETALEQTRALWDYLSEIDLPSTLERKSALLSEANMGLLAAEYSGLWDVVTGAMEQFAALLGDVPMTQNEFAELFLKTISRYDISVIPVSADSVSAGDFDRMRRRHIKHLIVLGADDEALPAPLPSGGLLSPDERDALAALGVSLGGGKEDYSRELSLIYNCMSLPSDTLTMSYCGFDEHGNKTRGAVVVSRAKQLFSLEEKTFDAETARLCSPETVFMLAAQPTGGAAHALALEYVRSGEDSARLDALKERASMGRGSLSDESVSALYGSSVCISPSRADSFTSCRFAYFLRYGLRLDDRETYAFEAPELGSFTHYVLENTAREIRDGVGFKAADEALCGALADKYTDEYVETNLRGFADKSKRFIYLFNRLRPSVKRVTTDMVRELSKSDFEPLDFELRFGRGGKMPAVRLSDGESELLINGVADRVDGYLRDGKLYLRVVDYKTGKKTFSLSDVWYGLGMQMLLYLFALEGGGSELYGAEIVPAGVMYVPAGDKPVSADGDLTDEALYERKTKARRRSGLVLDDDAIIEAMEHGRNAEYIPVTYDKSGKRKDDSVADSEQFKALRRHVEGRMLELQASLTSGSIDASPCYKSEQDNACVWCPFMSVCRFDEKTDCRRYLARVKPEEFWTKVGEEA